jgi:hypothetical protein
MRTKITRASVETALMRVLDAMAQDAIDASDEEITQAATDLRMDITRKHSAAFAGLTYFARPQLADFFDIEAPPRLPAPRIVGDRPKQPRLSTERKPRGGK